MDVIWGDLSQFITDELLNKYDRIGKFGHLILYRNTEKINRLFMLPGAACPYTTVFRDESHYGFDEITGLNLICNQNGCQYYCSLPIADANWLLSRISISATKTEDEIYFWQNGKVYRANICGEDFKLSEYAYLHFQKKHPQYYYGQNYEKGFIIKSVEFKPFPEKISYNIIRSESEFCGKCHDRVSLCYGNWKRIENILFVKSWHEKRILLKKAVALLQNRINIFIYRKFRNIFDVDAL